MPTLVNIICKKCNTPFNRKINWHNHAIKMGWIEFCSPTCRDKYFSTRVDVTCNNCGINFSKKPCEITSKLGNNFCSRSCSATQNNAHRTSGTRRSKLEKWIEEQLNILYPDLSIIYNGKEAIGSELDIFIPELKLAFELNGIVHYEPIYGNIKLSKIQTNDQNKFKMCIEHNIDLCIIDVASLKYFKLSNVQKYLDIIINIINLNLGMEGSNL